MVRRPNPVDSTMMINDENICDNDYIMTAYFSMIMIFEYCANVNNGNKIIVLLLL